MLLSCEREKIVFISRDLSRGEKIVQVLAGEGFTVHSLTIKDIESLFLQNDPTYSCIIVDLNVVEYFENALMDREKTGAFGVYGPILVLTDDGDKSCYIGGIPVFDSIPKMVPEKILLGKVKNALRYRVQTGKLNDLHRAVAAETGRLFIVGPNETMRNELISCIDGVRAGKNIFLLGQPGTGKRTFARALHVFFPKYQLVEIDCDDLMGKFNFNKVATLSGKAFSREIIKINNHLETYPAKIFLVINFNKLEKTDIKIVKSLKRLLISAGNDIQVVATGVPGNSKWIETSRSIKDLLKMMNPLKIKFPAMRNRKNDILVFAHYFMRRAVIKYQRSPFKLTREIEQLLLGYDWFGNLNELEMVMDRGVLIAGNGTVTLENLMCYRSPYLAGAKTFKDAKNDFERQYLIALLLSTMGNISQAARIAKKERKDLYYLIKKHRIEPQTLNLKHFYRLYK